MLVDTKIELIDRVSIGLIEDASLDEVIKILKRMIDPDMMGSYSYGTKEYAFILKIWNWLLQLKRYQEKEDSGWE